MDTKTYQVNKTYTDKEVKKVDDRVNTLLSKSSNLYNAKTTLTDTIVNQSGNVVPSGASNDLSDFIQVEPNKVYTCKGAFSIVLYTTEKAFIRRLDLAADTQDSYTFTNGNNVYYIRLLMTRSNAPISQLNKSDILLEYEPYYVTISKDLIPKDIEVIKPSKPHYFNPEHIDTHYISTDGEYLEFSTVAEYHNAFGELVTEYPEYLSRVLKGKDTSELYDIYEYSAKPQQVSLANFTKNLPKITLVVGLHGGEKTSIFTMYYLIKDICENWKTNPVLEYLRWNVEIIFNPLANPWAFENGNGRHNVNAVDLNRNFPYNWNDELTGSEYSGTSPLSEKESQYVAEMFEQNTDSIYMGDYHTNGSTTSVGYSWDIMLWISLSSSNFNDENLEIASKYTIEKMSRELIKRYGMPDNVGFFGTVSYVNIPGGAKTYASSLGVPSCTFECFMSMPTDGIWFSETTIRSSTDYLGTWLMALINQFKKVY